MQDTLEAMNRQAAIMQGQSDILAKSVAVAQETAEYSRESLLAIKSKERARITIDNLNLEYKYETPVVTYKLTCHGTTPAFIFSSWEDTRLCPVPDYEWLSTAYGKDVYKLPSVLPNGSTEELTLVMGRDERQSFNEIVESIKSGDLYLFFRVHIVYLDVFNDRQELNVSKIYGIMKDKSYASIADIYGLLSPQWHNSQYKYGEEAE